jgi:hypothetical protein
MAQSVSVGPIIALGGLAGGRPSPAEYSVEIGPSIFWQGIGLPAPGTGSKDKKGMGSMPALYLSTIVQALNQAIQPAGLALTVAAPAQSGVPLPLATVYAPGIAPGTPGPTGARGVGIETGYSMGATVSNSGTVTLALANDTWRFAVGQFVSVAGAGAGGSMLFAKVTAINPVGTITISPPAVVTQAAAAIGCYGGDPSSYAFTQHGNLPSFYSPFMNGGAGRFLAPDSSCARGVGVVSLGGSPAGNVLIQGLDIYMRPQSEIIATPAGAATTYGRKTYKIFLAAIPQYTAGQNVTVITSDLIGMPVCLLPNQPIPTITLAGVGYAPDALTQYADLTYPATTSTMDPRGALQVSAAGPVTGGTPGTGGDGTSRFVIQQTLTVMQVLSASASQSNAETLFGVPPV